MSKFFIVGLLIYNIATGICFSSEYDGGLNEDDTNDARFNLLELLKSSYLQKYENRRETTDRNLENWTGRWMPDRLGDPTPPPKVWPTDNRVQVSHESLHHVAMGNLSPACDDGKTNLTVDWNNSPVNYTCYGRKIIPNFGINPILYSEPIPSAYTAPHKCMSETIEYDADVPLFGAHRPVWPVYGEYKFLPKQRWIHSLEHGAVVMLYHPCANPVEVKRLGTLVKNCLRRYIISPYSLLSEERPLALLTWGHHLAMSYVNPDIVKNYIRKNALRGPEVVSNDGEFKEGLLIRSRTVTDMYDSALCPNM